MGSFQVSVASWLNEFRRSLLIWKELICRRGRTGILCNCGLVSQLLPVVAACHAKGIYLIMITLISIIPCSCRFLGCWETWWFCLLSCCVVSSANIEAFSLTGSQLFSQWIHICGVIFVPLAGGTNINHFPEKKCLYNWPDFGSFGWDIKSCMSFLQGGYAWRVRNAT